MIEVINYQNKDYEQDREQIINSAYEEVRHLLPTLPEKIKIYFDDVGTIPEFGTGAFAYSSDIITISLDPHFPDKEKQTSSLRPTVFHESLHIYQNYTIQGEKYPPLETALYEGMATVFERDYANTSQPFGDYSELSEEKLSSWIGELSQIPAEDYSNEVHSEWAFHHNEKNERWIIYRLGTWMVDQVLRKYNLDILDLKDKNAKDVLGLFNNIPSQTNN